MIIAMSLRWISRPPTSPLYVTPSLFARFCYLQASVFTPGWRGTVGVKCPAQQNNDSCGVSIRSPKFIVLFNYYFFQNLSYETSHSTNYNFIRGIVNNNLRCSPWIQFPSTTSSTKYNE